MAGAALLDVLASTYLVVVRGDAKRAQILTPRRTVGRRRSNEPPSSQAVRRFRYGLGRAHEWRQTVRPSSYAAAKLSMPILHLASLSARLRPVLQYRLCSMVMSIVLPTRPRLCPRHSFQLTPKSWRLILAWRRTRPAPSDPCLSIVRPSLPTTEFAIGKVVTLSSTSRDTPRIISARLRMLVARACDFYLIAVNVIRGDSRHPRKISTAEVRVTLRLSVQMFRHRWSLPQTTGLGFSGSKTVTAHVLEVAAHYVTIMCARGTSRV